MVAVTTPRVLMGLGFAIREMLIDLGTTSQLLDRAVHLTIITLDRHIDRGYTHT